MEKFVYKAGMAWTNEVLKCLASQLLNICNMLPSNESLKDLQSQLLNIYRMDPLCNIPKDLILDHLVGIVKDLTSQNVMTGISHYKIVDKLIQNIMLLLSLAESISQKSPISDILNNLLSHVLKIFRIIEPISEIKGRLELATEICKGLMSDIVDMYWMEWDTVNGKLNENDSEVSAITIFDHLVGTLRYKLSEVMGIKHVKGKNPNQILDLFVWMLQQLSSLCTDDCVHCILQTTIREHLTWTIKALMSLLADMSEMAMINGKLMKMLSQLVNMTSVNPVIEMPEKIQLLIEMDPENVPEDLIMYHLGDIVKYLKSVIASSLGPVVWLPRNILLLCLNLPKMLPDVQKYLRSKIMKILELVPGMPNRQILDHVCVLTVDLMPLVTLSKEHFLGDKSENLEFLSILYKDIHSELVKIYRTDWRNDIRYTQMHTGEMLHESESLNSLEPRIPQNLILDYLSGKLHETLSQVMRINRVKGKHNDQMLEILVTILQYLTTKIRDDCVQCVSGIPKSEIRDLLTGTIKALLSLLVNTAEKALMKQKLKDILSQLLKMSSLEFVFEMPENIWLLIKMCSDNIPINLVVYHLLDIFEYLRSLIDSRTGYPVIWVPRNLLLLCLNVPKLLPWGFQKKLFSHLKNMLHPGEAWNEQTEDSISVLPVDLMPLLIHVAKLTKIYKDEILVPAHKIIHNKKVMLSQSISKIEWTSKKFREILLDLVCICEMLPQEDSRNIKDLQSQLINVLRWIKFSNRIPKDVMLDHLLVILQDLLPPIMDIIPASGLQKNQILDSVYQLIVALLLLSKDIPEIVSINQILKEMMSWLVKISRVQYVREIWQKLALVVDVFKDAYSELVNICWSEWKSEILYTQMNQDKLLHESELLKSFKSEILNIYRIPLHSILQFLFQLIHEKLSVGNPISGVPMNQVLDTLICIQENLMSQVINDNVSEINKNKIWDHSVHIIQDKLSTVLQFEPSHIISQTLVLNYLVGILQQLTSLVMKGSVPVSGIPKNEIWELLIGIIKTLLSFLVNIPEKAPIKEKLKHMLSVLLNMSNLNTVIEIPDNIRLFVEMNPEDVPIDLIVEHLGEIKQYLESITDSSSGPLVWVPRKLMMLFLNIPRMLPWNLEKKLQLHFKKLLHCESGMPNDHTKDPVSVLIVDLLPLRKMMEFLVLSPKNEIQNFVISTSMDKLLLFWKVTQTEWTCDKIKNLPSVLMNVCNKLPENELVNDLQSQLLNMVYWTEHGGVIPKDMIYDHLVGILLDIMSETMEMNIDSEPTKKLIGDQLHAITKTLLSLALNNSEASYMKGGFEGMLMWFMKVSIIDPVSKIKANLNIVQDVWKGLTQNLLNRTIREWENERIKSQIYSGELPPETQLQSESKEQDVLRFLFEMIQDKLSEVVLGINHIERQTKHQPLNHFIQILQHLTSLVIDKHVSGIPKSNFRDILIGTIQSLLSLLGNISKMTLIKEKLINMLSQLVNISSLNPDIVIPENLRLLVERDHEREPLNLRHLGEIKKYLESLIKSRTCNVVWVPRKLLLLFLNLPKQLPLNFQNRLHSHLLNDKIGNPDNKIENPVSVILVDLLPLMTVMEWYTTSNNEILAHQITKDELSQLANMSKLECTSKTFKDLLSQIMDLCQMFHTNQPTKDLWSETEKLYRNVPLSGIPEIFLDHLLVILEDLTTQVMHIDPVKGVHLNPIFPRISVADILTDHIAGIGTEEVPADIVADHQAAMFRDQYYIFQDKEVVHLKVITRNQALEDLVGIITSLQSLSEMASVNGKLENILAGINKFRMDDKTKIDPEREALREYGLQLLRICQRLPESLLLENNVLQLEYLYNLDHASEVPKAVIKDRLITIHYDLSDKVSKSVNEELEELVAGLTSRKESVTDMVSQLMDHIKLDPENKLFKNLLSQNMGLLNMSKNDIAKIPTDMLLGVLFLINRPVSLDMYKIAKEEMEEYLRGTGKDLMLLLQYVHLVEGETKNISSQVGNEASMEWTSEAIKYLVKWFMNVFGILPESELLKDLQLQLLNIYRINNLKRPSEDVLLDHMVAILSDLISQTLLIKDISGIHKNQILEELMGITMGLMSIAGKISKLTPVYKILEYTLSRVNEARMNPESKAFRGLILSMIGISKTSELKGTGQDKILDHIHMTFRYLLSVSLSASELTGIRSNLKMLLSHLMNISRTDPVSGLPTDLLSLVIYSFFPASHMFYHPSIANHHLMPCYILKVAENIKFIYTGSLPESLHLPHIHELLKGNSPLFPDTDRMTDTGWFCECYSSMTMELDEVQPVFCRIKHGMESENTGRLLSAVSDGLYLNSAKINYLFRRCYADIPEFNKYSNKTRYDSASMEFASADPRSAQSLHSDVLFCLPVALGENLQQNFLGRLQANKWPVNCIPDLAMLLSERVYAIPKPDPHSDGGNLRWRLSFSVIEVELARSLSDIQRRCYRVLKAMIKYLVNLGLSENKQFPSYYLKTVMFWLCESTSEDSWGIQSLGIQWLKLLDSVIESLEKKELLMYFVPTYNLLKGKDTSLINVWMEQMKKIREEPLDAFIKFHSVYEVGNLRSEDWRLGFHNCLVNMDKTYSTNLITNGNLKNVGLHHGYHDAILTSHWTVAKYLLATYSLQDLLKYLKIYPQANEIILGSKAESKEHLIWLFYNELLSVRFPPYLKGHVHGIPDNYSKYWSFLAEVTHHIVLKYRNDVRYTGLLSVQTCERFYLIACSIENHFEKVNSEEYIKFANYLFVEEQYEEAVQILSTACQRIPVELICTFSRVTSEVLDTCLKLTVAFQDDVSHPSDTFAYHLLTSCYIQTGVLAEVCFLEDVEWQQWKVLLGFQFITRGLLQEAFQNFAHIHDGNMLSFNVKYAAMLFIIARVYVIVYETNLK